MENFHWREKNVVELLRKSGKLKTSDIIKNSNMCKVTALKYMNRLKRKGVIDFESVGPTKLWYVKDEGTRKKLNAEDGRKIIELLKDFEEIVGVKANLIITSNGVALTLDDPRFNTILNKGSSVRVYD